MRPTRTQYFFAHNWPQKIWLGGFALCGALIAFVACVPDPEMELNLLLLIRLLIVMACASIAGFLIAGLSSFFVISPFYLLRIALNGGPYYVGDKVQILKGPHQNVVSQIYDIWTEKKLVRVKLDETDREKYTDVFAEYEVYRVEKIPLNNLQKDMIAAAIGHFTAVFSFFALALVNLYWDIAAIDTAPINENIYYEDPGSPWLSILVFMSFLNVILYARMKYHHVQEGIENQLLGQDPSRKQETK